MALTFARVPDQEDYFGRKHVTVFDVTLDDDYPSSTGYVINAQDVGQKNLLGAQIIAGNQASGKLLFVIDKNTTPGVLGTSLRLRAFFPTGGATAAPTTMANPIVTSGGATASAVDATTPNLTPGVAKEVANLSDLATMQLRILFYGF